MKRGRGWAFDGGRWDHDLRRSRLAAVAGAFDGIAAVRRRIQRYNPILTNFEEGLG